GAPRAHVLARRHAQQPLEAALEMERAHVRDAAEPLERHRLVEMRVEVRLRALDARGRRGRSIAVPPAAPARAVARGLGFGRRREERHVLAPWPPRRAHGPAVDTRRRDGVDEAPVRLRIAAQHGRPCLLGRGERRTGRPPAAAGLPLCSHHGSTPDDRIAGHARNLASARPAAIRILRSKAARRATRSAARYRRPASSDRFSRRAHPRRIPAQRLSRRSLHPVGEARRMPPELDIVALDADDTLWHNEPVFQAVQARFRELLAPYHDAEWIDRRLTETEKRNLRHFGYGVKGFTLSMVETAVELTEGRISGSDIQRIVDWGREMLQHPVELLDGAAEAVRELAERHRLMLVTKGDPYDQESKL